MGAFCIYRPFMGRKRPPRITPPEPSRIVCEAFVLNWSPVYAVSSAEREIATAFCRGMSRLLFSRRTSRERNVYKTGCRVYSMNDRPSHKACHEQLREAWTSLQTAAAWLALGESERRPGEPPAALTHPELAADLRNAESAFWSAYGQARDTGNGAELRGIAAIEREIRRMKGADRGFRKGL